MFHDKYKHANVEDAQFAYEIDWRIVPYIQNVEFHVLR